MKVLLCDAPDEVTRLMHALLIADPSLEIDVTTEGIRVIQLAASGRPDVIVTELALEGMPASELVKRLREASPFGRVIGWTRVRDPARIARVLSAGVAGYVLKEDGTDQVVRAIASSAAVVLSPGAAALIGDDLGTALVRAVELEAELAETRRQLEAGSVAKAEFLANVSHELRTPVTVAKGISYVLRNPDINNEEREGFIAQLQSSLDSLASLVDEIIEIAEIERGTFELNISFTDLAPLIARAVYEVGQRYPDNPIESWLPPSLSALADAARIGGVIEELLDNACRYSPEGDSVSIRARVMDQGIVISVTDRGLGLGREIAQRSFEQPFSTGEATLRKEKAGAGVGLHLSRQLIVQHGGILWADPLPAGGTRVSFCLPSEAGAVFEAPPDAA